MRLWLTFIAGPNSLADLQEMVEPIRELFAGLVVTYHGERDDLEAQYLEIVKGAGRVIYQPYCGRHDHSRNTALWCGPIQQGDWCVQTDVLEHPNADFIRDEVPRLIPLCADASTSPFRRLNCFLYYGKPFIFRYHESMRYVGTPHEGLRRDDGGLRVYELNQHWPDESKVRLNVRPLKRKDPYHWLGHYVRYYLATPWGANHCLLGNEHRGDPMKLYQEREALRIEVREYLRAQGVPLTETGLKKYLLAGITPTMAGYIERERILNDAYRYWVLGDLTVRDDHTWAGMVKVNQSSS